MNIITLRVKMNVVSLNTFLISSLYQNYYSVCLCVQLTPLSLIINKYNNHNLKALAPVWPSVPCASFDITKKHSIQ